ncbi:TPA: nuclear transport factor 2 family protein [Pluralibacter gergoviae]|uniref:Polyketide cyclase n=1 Tax=Pluralibacter gergoviae TaxID=61647 RepID=A0A0J5L7D3_PLUGE|nr:nuclear transport factor 2 family protein [Pluralibacter gergoviae]KMK15603.1 polyketide cyclase [Pluralibacter gergoviae]KMK26212.1 polyketide cyclase [Pluralibacter gergoviae]MBL3692881.1 nuclear transport factor 2 family protein [Pluralibacter gergoviae]HDS1151164.1 nuclear transport factor 2 family protein [Pluralibacter gergoviae]
MNDRDALRLQQLEDEQAARRCISRYMQLCDGLDNAEAAAAIGALFCKDAIWQGVGEPYASRLGRHCGRDAIVAMMSGYVRRPAHFALNAHFLCSESLGHGADGALRGRWMMLQMSSFSAGGSHLNAAEINVVFHREEGEVQIRSFTTRNLFSRPVDRWHAQDELPVPNSSHDTQE